MVSSHADADRGVGSSEIRGTPERLRNLFFPLRTGCVVLGGLLWDGRRWPAWWWPAPSCQGVVTPSWRCHYMWIHEGKGVWSGDSQIASVGI